MRPDLVGESSAASGSRRRSGGRDQPDGEDVLYTTTWTGPDGTVLRIDATPTTAPSPPPNVQSSSSTPQPAFGSAQRYVFSGGSLPQCATQCTSYRIDDESGGGFAIVAGGGGSETAAAVAGRAAEALAPYDG